MTGPEEYRVGDMTLVGNVRLVPHLADAYWRLANELIAAAEKEPGEIAYPAGAVLVAAAGIEAYVNAVISMATFGADAEATVEQRRQLRRLGTNVVAKLERLSNLATTPNAITRATLDDVVTIVGLRGLLAHYDIQEEHPTQTRYGRTIRQNVSSCVSTAGRPASA